MSVFSIIQSVTFLSPSVIFEYGHLILLSRTRSFYNRYIGHRIRCATSESILCKTPVLGTYCIIICRIRVLLTRSRFIKIKQAHLLLLLFARALLFFVGKDRPIQINGEAFVEKYINSHCPYKWFENELRRSLVDSTASARLRGCLLFLIVLLQHDLQFIHTYILRINNQLNAVQGRRRLKR